MCALLLLMALSANPGIAQRLDPQFTDDIGIDQKLNEQVPLDLEFTDEAGRVVELGEYFGEKPVALALVYYECPMLCTQVLNGLLGSFRALSFGIGEEFEVVTVSIDPGEGPKLAAAKKKEYVGRYGRNGGADGWHFLTGSQDQITKLAESVGFRYVYDAETDLYIHGSGIMVLTPTGKLARYFYGIEYSVKDLRLGLVEAADNKIGSAVDQLLLTCYQYDPTTGKYGLVIMNSLRLGGFATVAALAAFVTVMIRRDRRGGAPSATSTHTHT
jgi:protein SCO1/2